MRRVTDRVTDIDALLGELTLEEKAALTAGEDFWSTVAVDRLGIPKVWLTDGPNGARGSSLGRGRPPTSLCIPCGSALGATWDPDARSSEVGALLGREARDRGVPACCSPRRSTSTARPSPAATSSATPRTRCCRASWPPGSSGACSRRAWPPPSKHFVGNDAEFERHAHHSVIDERALRELYLLPFELASARAARSG